MVKNTGSVKNRKSKKPTKCLNLVDFVVIKKRDKKSQKLVAKKISVKPVKRGKIRKKKSTTLKKKVLRERKSKKIVQPEPDEIEINKDLASLEENIKALEISTRIEEISPAVQHSRNFRDYCDHFITQDIKHYSEIVIKDLFRYQENKFQQNPGRF